MSPTIIRVMMLSRVECLVSIMIMSLISKNSIWKKVLPYVTLTTGRMLRYSSES